MRKEKKDTVSPLASITAKQRQTHQKTHRVTSVTRMTRMTHFFVCDARVRHKCMFSEVLRKKYLSRNYGKFLHHIRQLIANRKPRYIFYWQWLPPAHYGGVVIDIQKRTIYAGDSLRRPLPRGIENHIEWLLNKIVENSPVKCFLPT